MLQTTGKDYYDIPDDELPSANFAARPSSEISELGFLDMDRLWTFITPVNTGDSFDDGPTPTALTPGTILMPQPDMPRTPPDTPAVKVPSPSRRKSLRQHLRRVSDVAAIVRIPSMRQKSDTAPPGAFTSAEYAPQVPRRAMSARLDKRDAARVRHSKYLPDGELKARTVPGIDESVLEEAAQDESSSGNTTPGFSHPTTSFSRKPRVRETLERKQLSRLRMDFIAVEPGDFVDSPQSMLGTPEELYAAPQPQLQPGQFRPSSAIHGRRGSSTPVSPKTPSPSPWRTPPQPQPPQSNEDFSMEDLNQTTIYVPGPIRLEKHPAVPRMNSVATLDPFTSEIDWTRRPSDLLALEQVVVFFDSMGLNQMATNACLDRYWLTTALHETDLEVMEAGSWSVHSTSTQEARSTLSKFSFSSASSGASVQQDSPQKRQLIRLRRLLSPALPGLKGAEG